MIRKMSSSGMGRSDHGWLKSLFHFSFAEYYNRENMNFGVLRVINDDLVASMTGFDTHPHRDMEIISYIVSGELTHGDSLGNKRTLTRGQVQYMSAGSGVTHSEHNLGKEVLRFLQIWILPDQKHHTPVYGDYAFEWPLRQNQWLHLVSPAGSSAPIHLHQDANLYVTELDAEKSLDFEVGRNRQAYLVQIEGESLINGLRIETRDAVESVGESLHIQSVTKSHILVVEMAAV
jgi:hypothetical protein